MNLTTNFTKEEFERSQTAKRLGIKNEMNETETVRATNLCKKILQPLRNKYGSIIISSGFRCKVLNQQIGGSKTSQHVKAEAADIQGKDNSKLFNYIKDNLEFDQLIWEYGNEYQPDWVHVSLKKENNRKQIIIMK